MGTRKPISQAIQTAVLTKSRRRCCLCFFQDGDSTIKDGQIAHLDKDRNNNDENNLVFLCFPHHSAFDSHPSQAKGITAGEIRVARDRLYRALSDTDGEAHLGDSGSSVCVRTGMRSVELVLNTDFDSFTDADQAKILNAIGELLGRRDIRARGRRKGSVILTVELTPAEAERLLWAVNAGELNELGVRDARLTDDSIERTPAPTSPMSSRAGASPGIESSDRQVVFEMRDDYARLLDQTRELVLQVDGLYDAFRGYDDLRDRLSAVFDVGLAIREDVRRLAAKAREAQYQRQTGEWSYREKYGALAGKRILIADDEELVRETIRDVLLGLGCDVLTAPDGEVAIKLLETKSFDLVLSDIRMPKLSGYDVFSAAKNLDPDLPVILTTGFGYDPNHSIIRARREGLAAVLFKPFKVDQLLGELVAAITSRRSAS